jgi:hypothetical protein
MTELTKIVVNHLILTDDGKCAVEGHELIPRACIHCGLTIHQISDANNGVLPMRDTADERAEIKQLLEKRLKAAKDEVIKVGQQIKVLLEKLA